MHSIRRTFLIFVLGLFMIFVIPTLVNAQGIVQPTYGTGVITQITQETETHETAITGYIQELTVQEDGSGINRSVTAGSDQFPLTGIQRYHVGQHVILVAQQGEQGNTEYAISDQYRIPVMIGLTVLFFVIVLLVSRVKGFTSLLGMVFSLLILLFFMVPHIAAGENPVLISIISAGIISAVVIYFGHGFHYRSHIALFCMLITLAFVGLMSYVVVQLAYLTGLGDETASYLQFSGLGQINLQGLFLGGIILAALSVLDDSVISQVSVIYQLKEVKPDIHMKELFRRGMEVGRDHISTLVNTLILAYAGASLPLFILFTVNASQPAWVSLNDQMIAEEVVRTLTGSIGLVLSIPLTTFIAAYVIGKRTSVEKKKAVASEHIH